jgi:uncharacterized membrane protein
MSQWQSVILWVCVLCYVLARLAQLYADQFPTLLIVILHVVPPAAFALVHGSVLYRWRGILTFTLFCLGVGGISESLSLRTGFPFGRYHFTEVMGPKFLGLPLLLVLAYLGLGYLSWVLALLILGYRNQPLRGVRVTAMPLLASFLMLAWDLSMEADWSTLDRAWIWREGGPFFGVPVSNFFGWFLTAYMFYQAFAVYCHVPSTPTRICSRSCWRAALLFYGCCASGNLLIVRLTMAPPVVSDASGRDWRTRDILAVIVLMSLLVMLPMTLLASAEGAGGSPSF